MRTRYLCLLLLTGCLLTSCAHKEYTLEDVSKEQISTKTEKKELKVLEKVPFSTRKILDTTLDANEQKVMQQGKDGKSEVTYEITYKNGKEVARVPIHEKILLKAQQEIIHVGSALKNAIESENETFPERESEGRSSSSRPKATTSSPSSTRPSRSPSTPAKPPTSNIPAESKPEEISSPAPVTPPEEKEPIESSTPEEETSSSPEASSEESSEEESKEDGSNDEGEEDPEEPPNPSPEEEEEP